MQRGRRALHIRNHRRAARIELLELAWVIRNRTRDMGHANGEFETKARLAAILSGGRHITRRRRRTTGRAGVEGEGFAAQLRVGNDGTVGTHLAAGDAFFGVAEDEGGDEVEKAHERGEDAGGDDDAPEGKAKVLNTSGLLVEVSKDVEAQADHGDAQEDETGFGTEEGPFVGEVVLEEGEGKF